MKGAKTAEEYILGHPEWQGELIELRRIMLSCKLDETIKWGVPVYTFRGKNLAGLAAFKNYTGIWFYQGSLLKDRAAKLINAQEGLTKALRQWRFVSVEEIDPKLIKEYVEEAIENEKSGGRIENAPKPGIEIPSELKEAMIADEILKTCFENLSPFRQREYLEYLWKAKKQETRQKRLEKIIPGILEGIGLNDKYR